MIKATTIGILGGALLLGTSAMAQDPGTTPPPAAAMEPAAPMGGAAGPQTGGGMPPITGVRAGGLAVWGSLDINANKGAFAKPISLSPDVLYGVSDVLSVGLIHSTYATTGFAGGTGTSLCLSGKTDGCGKLYNKLGVVGKYALSSDLALDGGLIIRQLSDPMMAGLKAGVSGRMMAGPVMVMYEPNLYIGATKRDLGNKERLNVPVTGFVPVGPVMAGVQTGISGPLSDFGKMYAIPLSFIGIMHINQSLMAGAALAFNNIAGKNHTGDARALNLFVGWNN